jgi:N-acetylmuramoyl-L-alanine amidase
MRLPLALLLVLAVPLRAAAQDAALPTDCGAAVPQRQLVVYLDAGHGGKIDGAIGRQGEKEKDVALKIAKRFKEELEKELGAKVGLTREGDTDVDLTDRMLKANDAHADVFISVHCNAMPLGPSRALTHGIETYFLSAEATGEQAARVVAAENAEARKAKASGDPLANILSDLARTEAHHDAATLAYAVHQRLVKDLGAPDRGVHQAPFIVLEGAQMPAILLEVGFLTHPAESKLLSDKDYQGKLAEALVAGIASFLDEVGRRGKASEPKPKPAADAGQPTTPP